MKDCDTCLAILIHSVESIRDLQVTAPSIKSSRTIVSVEARSVQLEGALNYSSIHLGQRQRRIRNQDNTDTVVSRASRCKQHEVDGWSLGSDGSFRLHFRASASGCNCRAWHCLLLFARQASWILSSPVYDRGRQRSKLEPAWSTYGLRT